MKPTRHGLTVVAGIAAVAAYAAVTTSGAVAASSPDEIPATEAEGLADDTNIGNDAGDDALSTAPSEAPSATSVALSGGLACAIPSIGEASTRWRYGRARSDASIDETTNRVRVSGSGGGCDGLKVDFSVELLLPALEVGCYRLTPTAGAPVGRAPPLWANLWARGDRASASPDIAWDTRLASPEARTPNAGRTPASLAVTITSVIEIAHTSERLRAGTLTLDTTRFRIHGSIAGTLPCIHAGAAYRSSCRAETLVGAF